MELWLNDFQNSTSLLVILKIIPGVDHAWPAWMSPTGHSSQQSMETGWTPPADSWSQGTCLLGSPLLGAGIVKLGCLAQTPASWGPSVMLREFKTPQTLPFHIFNDRLMPGVRDVHGDCKTVYHLKTPAVLWLTWHKCHYQKILNTAFRSLRSYNSWNGIVIKTTKQCDFDAHYNHNGAGINSLTLSQ